MRILITGAGGFIGRHLTAALLARGHQMVGAVRDVSTLRRRFPAIETIQVDFNRDTDPAIWRPRLSGIEAVINCAGILQETRRQSMDAIHYAAPKALFDACADLGVRRAIQISAVSIAAPTEYATSKRNADDHLASLDLDWTVLRPSLVYAEGSYGGTSLMRGMAALPWVMMLPGHGNQPFQPIHVDDLASTIIHLIEDGRGIRQVLQPVGPNTLTLRDILVRLRQWLALPPAHEIRVPMPLVRLAALVGDRVGGALNSTALHQLEHGNAAPMEPFTRVTGIQPKSMESVLAARPSHVQDRWHARLFFVRPLLRYTLALMWILSGLVGLIFLQTTATAIIPTQGFSETVINIAAFTACLVDFLVGIFVARGTRPRLMGTIQCAIILIYTVAFSWIAPHLWRDPFGPLLKNLPILAAILVSTAIEDER